jgi:alanyl-tRNA synthetase
MDHVREVDGIKVLSVQIDGQDAQGLRLVMDKLRERMPSGILVLGSALEDKAMLCVGVSKDLTSRAKAGEIVKKLAPMVGGGGGGRPDMAEAGGKLPAMLPELISKAPEVIRAMLA